MRRAFGEWASNHGLASWLGLFKAQKDVAWSSCFCIPSGWSLRMMPDSMTRRASRRCDRPVWLALALLLRCALGCRIGDGAVTVFLCAWVLTVGVAVYTLVPNRSDVFVGIPIACCMTWFVCRCCVNALSSNGIGGRGDRTVR